jgi:hypothetical protein
MYYITFALLHFTLHYFTLLYITLLCSTFHIIPFHSITLHHITLHYICESYVIWCRLWLFCILNKHLCIYPCREKCKYICTYIRHVIDMIRYMLWYMLCYDICYDMIWYISVYVCQSLAHITSNHPVVRKGPSTSSFISRHGMVCLVSCLTALMYAGSWPRSDARAQDFCIEKVLVTKCVNKTLMSMYCQCI